MFQKLALLATIVVGVTIGLLWPTPQRSSASPAKGSEAEVTIERNSDHHYYADAVVNGHSVHFMIDTGASETALTEADARAVGLQVDPSKYEVIGDGASGIVRGQYVQLKGIDLGGIRQQAVRAVIVPGATVSLLGQPFLEKVDEILIRQGEMRLLTKPIS
ncbi:MAG: TIGR02281 family clan AA aspartic protease [Sphingomicrobium sp.]